MGFEEWKPFVFKGLNITSLSIDTCIPRPLICFVTLNDMSMDNECLASLVLNALHSVVSPTQLFAPIRPLLRTVWACADYS